MLSTGLSHLAWVVNSSVTGMTSPGPEVRDACALTCRAVTRAVVTGAAELDSVQTGQAVGAPWAIELRIAEAV